MSDIFDTIQSDTQDIFDKISIEPEQPRVQQPLPDQELMDAMLARQNQPSPVVSTIAGGPRVPVSEFRETIAAPIQAAEELSEEPTQPALPLSQIVPEIRPDEKWYTAAAKTAGKLALGLPEFFTSPMGVAAAGAGFVAPVPTAIGFYGDITRGLVDAKFEAEKNWGNWTPAEKAQYIVNVLGSTTLLGGIGKGLSMKLAPTPKAEQAVATLVTPQKVESLPQAARALMEQEAEKPREVKVEDYVPEEPTEIAVKAEELAPAVPVVQAEPVPPAVTAKIEPATAATAGAPEINVFYDDAVKGFTATKFDERFGNMHGKGDTKEESIANLNKNIEQAYKHGTWRSVEHPQQPAAPAAQPGIGGPSAISQGPEQKSNQPQYQGTDAQRQTTGPSRSDQPQGSRTEPQAEQGQTKGEILLEPTPPAAPAAAQAKMQGEVAKVAATEGKRSAKEIKDELIQRLEEAVKKAPSEAELRETMRTASPSKVKDKSSWYTTIEIPEDGTFTVFNTKEAISLVLARAKRISLSKTPPRANVSRAAPDLNEQAEAASKAYGSPENAYRSVSRQRETLQSQEPPSNAEDRELWNNQIEGAIALQEKIYSSTKAGELESKAEAARDRVATYREGAKSFEGAIAKIEKIKRPTKAHKERLEDLKQRYAQNQEFIRTNERNAEQLEQQAAREKGALEAKQPPSPAPPEGQVRQPGPVGMGGAVPTEFTRAGGSPAATKFRMMDQARVARGLEPLLKPESVKDQAVLDRALAEYDRDPAGADVLADSLIKNPKPIEDWQNHYLLLRWIDTRDQFYKSAREAQVADADGRVADMARANEQTNRWSDSMSKLEQALRVVGSETGRALRARQVLIAEDFSLAGLETRRRAALGGRALTPDERAELQRMADQYKATADALQTRLTSETEARTRANEVIDRLNREIAAQPKLDKRVLAYAESIVAKMETAAEAASVRLHDRLSRLSAGVDPTILYDAAIVGSAKIARMGLDFAKWSDSMATDFGPKIVPMLKAIWDESNRVLEANLKKVPEAVQRAIKVVSPPERRAIWKNEIKKRLEKNERSYIAALVQKIARSYVEQGVRDRNALIDAVHGELQTIIPGMTRRDAMDAISGYGDYRQLSKGEIDTVLRDLKGQMQQVAKLEDMASGQAPMKTGYARRIPTDEERRLIQQVEEAKKRGGYAVTDPEAQLKTALDAVKTRLQNQIADLEQQISTREKIVKTRTQLEYDEQANRLKARRDELKKVFYEVFPKEPITEAERLVRWKKHLDTRIADFERRITERDFRKRERIPRPVPDAEALAKMDRLEQIREQFHEMLLRDKYKNMKLHEKAWLAAKESLNIPRNVMTSADVSAVLRQGGILAGSHPDIAAKALAPMLRGMASEKLAGIVNQEILQRPNAKTGRYAQAKLYLAPLRSTNLAAMEEQIMSRFAHHLPIVRASNRAFITFLNRIRADSFDALTERLEAKGKPLTDAELKVIGNYINIATGRGEMGRFAAAAEALATTFFSPRLVVSRFQYLMGQPLWRGTARTRRLIIEEYVRSFGALAVVLGLGAVAGATIEFDPRSSDFGKMVFGQTRLDPLAGLSQSAVLLTRIIGGQKKTAKGEIVPLRGKNLRYGLENTADVVWRFMRSKFSPVAGSLLNIASGENVVGEPVTPGQELGRMLVPLSFQDVFKVMKEQGVSRGTALMILSLFGMSLQYYDQNQRKPSTGRPTRPSRPSRPSA